MAKDYSALQDKAKDLIEHYGRTVELLKESRTSADPSAPLGRNNDRGDSGH